MSTATDTVGQGEERTQVEVTVRQAAKIAGVSTKQVRRWIREGAVRATMREAKHGPTWHIEAASLPPPRSLDTARTGDGEGGTPTRQGSPGKVRQGEGEGADLAAGLLALVREKDAALEGWRRELEAAAGRIGYLEAEAGRVKLLAKRAESLEGERMDLRGEVGRLRERVRLRTWALALALAGFVVVIGTLALR